MVKTVIVTPGRVAFLTPAAKAKFTDKPTTVVWNAYYEELLNVHGDITEIKRKPTPVAEFSAVIHGPNGV